MTIISAYQQLVTELTPLYNENEAAVIAGMVFEKITGERRITRRLEQIVLSPGQQNDLEKYRQQLLEYRPVQYVLHEAWFQDMRFYVDEQVLIPRPETEELVEWIVTDFRTSEEPFTLLDIGSGSGCIPISLAKKLPCCIVHSCDVSSGALEVSNRNAHELGAKVQWHQADFLDSSMWDNLPAAEVIVSNPPYIPQSGKSGMDKHVVDFEPGIALFVPDNNALIFYEAIAAFVNIRAKAGAAIYVEIHEGLASEVQAVFAASGLTEIQVRLDMQGKERMIRAVKA
ncbi:peptide chain release factor N(5)-glutamine methyltransferase [Flavihumibacter solisilvae]|uniref:peptide chain release factor N(5)-glutamine methyltransferase n=1 Tax=Flavihumibacter solisilvae TaxID=1349421 RepID=UPI00068BE59D|nr:peptide chain release factor N(5)-glutamine methyltransferase [Flavihumibacter solisilvae]